MRQIKLIVTALCVIFNYIAIAQTPMITVQNDKKKINVHELGLPESTKLIDVLYVLPELLSRPGTFYLDNYAIEVNDVQVTDARDAVLSQLCIADIKFIEVNENPITSYQNNGQGGTISIELVDLENKKVMGSVSISGRYPVDIVPSLNIGYANEKFSVRGMVLGEYYNPKNIKETTNNQILEDVITKLTDESFFTEMARVYFTYNPSENDKLKFCLSENWRKSNSTAKTNTQFYDNTIKTSSINSKETLTNLLARIEYNHFFANKSRLKLETVFNYDPNKKYYNDELYLLGDTISSYSLAGKVEYLLPLMKPQVTNKAEMKFGVNFNLKKTADDINLETSVLALNKGIEILSTDCATTYLSPYFQTEYIHNNLSFKLILDYQYYKYNIKEKRSNEFDKTQNNLTGKLMGGWKFAPNQTLRLIFDRKLKRPTSTQIYPFVVYNPNYNSFVLGNSDLKPLLSHELTIDYITEVKQEKHSVVLNVGLSYIYVNDVIEQTLKSFSTYYLRPTNDYITFLNQGNNSIMKTNFMLLYKRKIFSLLFTANVFNNIGSKDSRTSSHYTYYNAMICPSFNFKKGWSFEVDLTYNSEIRKPSEKLGDILSSGFTVAKTFGKFRIDAYGLFSLKDSTVDIVYSQEADITRTYDAVRNMVGIGFRYQF